MCRMDSKIDAAAAALSRAAETGVPTEPVRDLLGSSTDLDLAYRVQQINVEADVERGRRIAGHKIGLTSEAVQRQLGVDQPDFGVLFSDMCFVDGSDVPSQRLLQPRVEAEIALVLESDLTAGQHTVAELMSAIAYVVPAIEIVDSRVADWDITIVDTIADNASCGLVVLGTRPVSLRSVDLRNVRVDLTIGGRSASRGTGADCLGNPLAAARWLADVLCERGDPLRAGDCVMTGALGPMVSIASGDEVVADFGEFGSVTTKVSVAA